MDKVHEVNDLECDIPSPESYRIILIKYNPLVALIIQNITQCKHLAISFNDRILFIQQPFKILKKNSLHKFIVNLQEKPLRAHLRTTAIFALKDALWYFALQLYNTVLENERSK